MALGTLLDVLGAFWGAFWALLDRSWSLLGSLGLQVVDFLVIFCRFLDDFQLFFSHLV